MENVNLTNMENWRTSSVVGVVKAVVRAAVVAVIVLLVVIVVVRGNVDFIA